MKSLTELFHQQGHNVVSEEPLWSWLREVKGFGTDRMSAALRWLSVEQGLISIQYASNAPMDVWTIALTAKGEHYAWVDAVQRREKRWAYARDIIATAIALVSLAVAIIGVMRC